MKKLLFILISVLFVLYSQTVFAQDEKPFVDKVSAWRNDKSCGLELNTLIRTYKDSAVDILQNCCKEHSSKCLDTYSGPDNKKLLYTAVEARAYKVIHFLFKLSQNYINSIDAYGKTITVREENEFLIFTITKEDKTSMTPLMLACYNGDLQASNILINYGANLLKRNYTSDGRPNKSAYDYAMANNNKDPKFIKYIQNEYHKLKSYGKILLHPQMYDSIKNERNPEQLKFEIEKQNLYKKNFVDVYDKPLESDLL